MVGRSYVHTSIGTFERVSGRPCSPQHPPPLAGRLAGKFLRPRKGEHCQANRRNLDGSHERRRNLTRLLPPSWPRVGGRTTRGVSPAPARRASADHPRPFARRPQRNQVTRTSVRWDRAGRRYRRSRRCSPPTTCDLPSLSREQRLVRSARPSRHHPHHPSHLRRVKPAWTRVPLHRPQASPEASLRQRVLARPNWCGT